MYCPVLGLDEADDRDRNQADGKDPFLSEQIGLNGIMKIPSPKLILYALFIGIIESDSPCQNQRSLILSCHLILLYLFSMLGYYITFKLILNRMGKEFCFKD